MTTASPKPRGAQRLLIAAMLASFFACAFVSLGQTPYGAAFGFSDHFTHMNAARLFPVAGLDLWRRPIAEMFPGADDAAKAAAPLDVQLAGGVREIPGWPAAKPFVGGWTHLARPYPPGDLLVVAPVALLYQLTPLSFGAACHLLLLLFLALAHVACWFIWRGMPAEGRALYAAAAVAVQAYLLFWTLRGFYDAAAMVPLSWCAASLAERRWLRASLGFALGLFIHYRALYYVPWAVVAAGQIAFHREWLRWKMADWVVAIAATALVALSLWTFILVTPTLGAVPLENPIRPGHLKAVPVACFVASTALAGALFVRARAALDGAMLIWIALMLVSVRQVQAWHAFLLFPWIFAPALGPSVRGGRAQLVAVVTAAVFL